MKSVKKRLLFITALIGGGYLIMYMTLSNIGVNITKSVPFTLYVINKSKREFHEGDYILFRSQADPLNILPEDAKLVKKIACVSGNHLSSDDNAFYCDGVLVAIRRDPKNMKFYFNGAVPSGKYFMTGTHFRSYDSRIWGFLDEKNIIGTVTPVF
ncbi:MAG: S26 family signal peptidase [Deferribacterales bacterium]